jgi:SAM-dependent methyltransferase
VVEPGSRSRPADYWEAIAREWAVVEPQRLWRAYCDRVTARLFDSWLPPEPVERLLKTDLFDEAHSGAGLVPLLEGRARILVGIDLSRLTLARAGARHPTLRPVGADVRRLPFADRSFDLVLSNSTLDHLESLSELAGALAELRRVLKTGGRLLLTLDNPANPVVALRNALPFGLLRWLRLVPYYVGATCGPRRLARLVREVGLVAREEGAMMHCPRVPAVLCANALDRLGHAGARAGFLRFLLAWERLARWPTRYRTGYFVVLVAERPEEGFVPSSSSAARSRG